MRNIQNTNASNAQAKIANTFGSTQYNSGDYYVRGGVFSHWFYLLVNGGTGTNDSGRSYTTYGVGMDVAENLIMNVVFNGYLSNTTSYAQIRTSTINAAKAIAGTNSYLAQQVENAWYAVGVGDTQHQSSISGPTTLCNQATYTINNFPQGATINWRTTGLILSISSGQGTSQVTVSKVASSKSTAIYADITVNGNTFTISITGIKVGTSAPTIALYESNGIYTIAPPYYAGTTYCISAVGTNTAGEPASNFSWTVIPPSGKREFTTYYIGSTFSFIPPVSGTYEFQLKYYKASECGWSDVVSQNYYFASSLYSYSIYPNPAENNITVELKANETGEATLFSAKSVLAEPYTIQIWSETQGLIRSVKSETFIQ